MITLGHFFFILNKMLKRTIYYKSKVVSLLYYNFLSHQTKSILRHILFIRIVVIRIQSSLGIVLGLGEDILGHPLVSAPGEFGDPRQLQLEHFVFDLIVHLVDDLCGLLDEILARHFLQFELLNFGFGRLFGLSG